MPMGTHTPRKGFGQRDPLKIAQMKSEFAQHLSLARDLSHKFAKEQGDNYADPFVQIEIALHGIEVAINDIQTTLDNLTNPDVL